MPEVPREPEDQPFPLLAMIAPILLGGAMFAMTGRPITLLFIAMTPIMMIGGYLTNRRRDKRKLAKQIARFDVGLAELGERLEAEKRIEHRARIAEIPSSAELVGSAAQLDPLLWTRRPEHWSFLSLRLGSAAMPSRNTVDDDQRGDLMFEFQERLDEVIAGPPPGRRRPIVVELGESGAIGVAGDKDAAAGVLSAVLVQLTGLHSPAELVLTAALTPEWSAELDWLKWLPHTSSPHSPLSGNHLAATEPAVAVLMDDLEDSSSKRERVATRARDAARGALAAERSALQAGANVGADTAAPRATTAPLPAVVVIIADHAMRDRSRLVDLSERGADVGVFPVWIAARRRTAARRVPRVRRPRRERGAEASASGSCASARRSRSPSSTGSRATRRPGTPEASAAWSTRTCRRRRVRHPDERLAGEPHRPRAALTARGGRRAVVGERLDHRPHAGPRPDAAPGRPPPRHDRPGRRTASCTSTCARTARTRSSAGRPARARASSCRPGCSAWPPSTAPTA